MATLEKKRKNRPTNEYFARSRKLTDAQSRPSKRLRPDEKDEELPAPKILHVPRISKVREEEVAFPRGGASLLTPLEHKQIQIEATRDVLFEQHSGQSKADLAGEDVVAIRKGRRPKSKSAKKITEGNEPQEEIVTIEGLSYKVSKIFCFQERQLIGSRDSLQDL